MQKAKTRLKGWKIEDPTWLDPSQGAGAFYKNYGEVTKIWCEIEKGHDFFNFPTCVAMRRHDSEEKTTRAHAFDLGKY